MKNRFIYWKIYRFEKFQKIIKKMLRNFITKPALLLKRNVDCVKYASVSYRNFSNQDDKVFTREELMKNNWHLDHGAQVNFFDDIK